MASSKRKRLEAEDEAASSPPWKKYCMDVDTLACPICTERFSPPVFQCVNGHAVCSSCCEKMDTRACPFCTLPIGTIRCLAIEKVIESLLVECKYFCTAALKFHDRDEHERSLCAYRPIKCPMHGCAKRGPMFTLHKHLAKEHDVSIAEWCESTQSTDFEMWDSKETAVFVQAKEVWLLVSLRPHHKGHWFFSKTIWASKEGVIKLTAKAFPQTLQRVHSIEYAFSHGDHHHEYMYFHGPDDSFEVTVSLIARL